MAVAKHGVRECYEKSIDAFGGALLPDCFIDGVPHVMVKVGIGSDGHPIYEPCQLQPPAGLPSLWWREGC